MHAVLIGETGHPDNVVCRALEAILAGVRNAGGSGECVFLSEFTILQCRHCGDHDGLCVSRGHCELDDDFGLVLDKLRHGDAAVFATRVSIPDFNYSLRALLERLHRTTGHPAGRRAVSGVPVVGVCVGGGASACTTKLGRALAQCGYSVLDLIAVGNGEIYTKKKLLEAGGERLAAEVRGASET